MSSVRALDTAVGSDGTLMNDVTGLTGFTGWKVDTPTAVSILSNEYKVTAGVFGGQGGIVCESAVGFAAFDYRASVKPSGTNSAFGLMFRCTEEAGAFQTNGDCFYTQFGSWAGSGDTATATISVFRRVAGTATEIDTVAGVTIPLVSGIDLGVTVSGSTMSIWTEPYGGGTRTTHKSGIDLTTDAGDGSDPFNDSLHQRFGINRTSNGEIGTLFKDIKVLLNSPPDAPTVFSSPLDGNTYQNRLKVSWNAAWDSDFGYGTYDDVIQYEGEYSSNGGSTWSSLFALQGSTKYTWDISGLSEGTQYMVRVRTYDGTDYSTTWLTSGEFSIAAPPGAGPDPDLSGGCTA